MRVSPSGKATTGASDKAACRAVLGRLGLINRAAAGVAGTSSGNFGWAARVKEHSTARKASSGEADDNEAEARPALAATSPGWSHLPRSVPQACQSPDKQGVKAAGHPP